MKKFNSKLIFKFVSRFSSIMWILLNTSRAKNTSRPVRTVMISNRLRSDSPMSGRSYLCCNSYRIVSASGKVLRFFGRQNPTGPLRFARAQCNVSKSNMGNVGRVIRCGDAPRFISFLFNYDLFKRNKAEVSVDAYRNNAIWYQFNHIYEINSSLVFQSMISYISMRATFINVCIANALLLYDDNCML